MKTLLQKQYYIVAALLVVISTDAFSQVFNCGTSQTINVCGGTYISLKFRCNFGELSLPEGTTQINIPSDPSNGGNPTTVIQGTLVDKPDALYTFNFPEPSEETFSLWVRRTPSIINTTPGSTCDNGSVTISANSNMPGSTLKWYNLPVGGSPITSGTDGNCSITSLPATTTYYVDATNSGSVYTCTTPTRMPVIATSTPTPSILGVQPGSVCDHGSVLLKAYATAGTVHWHDALTGGTDLGSGNNYSTTDLTEDKTYYVDAVFNNCTTATRTSVSATIYKTPSLTVTGNSRCGEGRVDLLATSDVGSVNWYNSSAGGPVIETGINFTTPVITTPTKTYYAQAENNGCKTAFTAVTATINPIPVINDAPDGKNCGPGNVVLTVTASSGTVNWYNSPVGGIPIISANSYSPSLSSTTTYYIDVTSVEGCTSSPREQVLAIINPKPVIDYNFVMSNSCSPAENVTGININADALGYTYSWAPPLSAETGQSVPCLADNNTYTVTATSNNCPTSLSIPVRKKYTTILVLDRTGSMGGHSTSTTSTKWNLLKSDINVLTALMNLNGISAIPPDLIGAIGYNTTQTVLSENGSSFFPVFESLPTTIKIEDFMDNTLSPSGSTSIGGALLKALQMVATETKPVYILLVSDGLQNSFPKINTTLGTIYDATGTKLNLDDIPTDVHIYCIGIGSGCNHDLLKYISITKGHGDYYSAFDPEEITPNVVDFYTAMYPESSPRLIRYYHESIVAMNQASKEFLTNSADKINFVLSYKPGEELNFTLKKGDLEIPFSPIIGSNYKMVTIDFPLKVNNTAINSAGLWKMVIRGNSANTKFKAFAIADVHKINCKFDAVKRGRFLELSLNSPDLNKYVKNVKITAKIYKPKEDANYILTKYSLNKFDTFRKDILLKDNKIINDFKAANPDFDGISDMKIKLHLLSENSLIKDLLLPKADSTITLMPGKGNGRFTAFTRCFLSGTYKIEFTVEGTTVNDEPFYRSSTREINISNLIFDYERSEFAFKEINPSNSIVLIKPKNVDGYIIIPGEENPLEVYVNGVKPQQVTYYLDGTIACYFNKLPLKTENSTLKLEVGKSSLFEKKIKDIKSTISKENIEDLELPLNPLKLEQ